MNETRYVAWAATGILILAILYAVAVLFDRHPGATGATGMLRSGPAAFAMAATPTSNG